MRLPHWILVIASFIPAGCKTEIRASGFGGNVSPADPDIVYFPAPNQNSSRTMPTNTIDIQHHESETSKRDYTTDPKQMSEQ